MNMVYKEIKRFNEMKSDSSDIAIKSPNTRSLFLISSMSIDMMICRHVAKHAQTT